MVDSNRFRSSEYWRDRAEEARSLAGEMKDEFSRATMLGVAADYDRLAERAERYQDEAAVSRFFGKR